MSDNKILDKDLNRKEQHYKLFNPKPAILWGILFLLGYLFRIQHYPGANFMIFSGAGGLMGYAVSTLVVFRAKNIQSIILCVFSLFWLGRMLYSMYFREGLIQYSASFLIIYGLVFFVSTIFHLLRNR